MLMNNDVTRTQNKNIKNRKLRLAGIISLSVILYAVYTAGILAYFKSSDMVTNRLDASHGSVTILEPAWDNEGKSMAKKSEPGMDIPKDPRAYNDGEVPLYIRIKMRIRLSGTKNNNLQGEDEDHGNYVGIPENKKRMAAVVKAIMLDGNHSMNGTYQNFILIDTDNDNSDMTKWTVSSCNNKYFLCDYKNHSSSSNELEFWFYYTGDNTGNETERKMVIRDPDEETAQLFQQINIPVYKRDYYGVFDQKYQIILRAEGVPAAAFGDHAPTMSDFINEADK